MILLVGCRPHIEKKLVGEWLSGCSIDVCTVTTLKSDSTFSQKFDEKDSTDSYSGTWGTEGDQLVLHVTWADKNLQDMIGKDLRVTISEFKQETFTATLAEDKRITGPWKRLR